jgi:hypothetical protein
MALYSKAVLGIQYASDAVFPSLKQVVTRVASSLENCGSHLTLTKVNTS